MAKSCDTDSQKYRKLMQWLQEDPKNLVPSAIEKALEDHPSTLLQQWQLFAASNGSLTEADWLAKSPSEKITLWLRQAMREMNVVVFAAQGLKLQ